MKLKDDPAVWLKPVGTTLKWVTKGVLVGLKTGVFVGLLVKVTVGLLVWV